MLNGGHFKQMRGATSVRTRWGRARTYAHMIANVFPGRQHTHVSNGGHVQQTRGAFSVCARWRRVRMYTDTYACQCFPKPKTHMSPPVSKTEQKPPDNVSCGKIVDGRKAVNNATSDRNLCDSLLLQWIACTYPQKEQICPMPYPISQVNGHVATLRTRISLMQEFTD